MEDMIVRIWESDNDLPGQEVFTQNIPQAGGGGHPAINTIIASGLDLRPHRVRLFAAVSGNLLHFYEAEPRIDVVTVFTPIRFKIGDAGALTPLPGTNEYIDPILDGLTTDEFIIIRNNIGALHPVTHYTFDEPNTKIVLVGADVFYIDEEFTIMLQPKSISTVVNDSVTGKWFGGFVDISSPLVYIAAHLRKLFRFKATTSYSFNIAPPASYAMVFQNEGPNANQVGTINFNIAPLLWGTGTLSSIQLPLHSEACFVYDGTNFNVVYITQSSFITDATVIKPGDTVGAGTVLFNDIPNGDTQYVLNHNLNIDGDYIIFFSRKAGTTGSAPRDNDIQISWLHHASAITKKDSVILNLGDPFNVAPVQQLTLCWLIIKM